MISDPLELAGARDLKSSLKTAYQFESGLFRTPDISLIEISSVFFYPPNTDTLPVLSYTFAPIPGLMLTKSVILVADVLLEVVSR